MVPSSEYHPNWIIGGFTVILHTLFFYGKYKKATNKDALSTNQNGMSHMGLEHCSFENLRACND